MDAFENSAPQPTKRDVYTIELLCSPRQFYKESGRNSREAASCSNRRRRVYDGSVTVPIRFFFPSSSLFCAAFLYESVRVVIACRRLDSNSIVTSQLVSDQEAAAHNDFSLSPTLPLRCCFYPAFGFPFSFTCRLLGLIDAKPPSISAHEQPTYTAFLAKPYRPFVRH